MPRSPFSIQFTSESGGAIEEADPPPTQGKHAELYSLSRNLVSDQEREETLRKICNSRMIGNWESFYIDHWLEYKQVNSFPIKYPNLYRLLQTWTRLSVIRTSYFMTLVNTICFILAIVTPYLNDCSIFENVPSVRILTTLKLIVPLALVGSHSSFVEVWKRKILASEKVVRYSDLLS